MTRDNQKLLEWDLCKGTGEKTQITGEEYTAEQIHHKEEENMNKFLHGIKKNLGALFHAYSIFSYLSEENNEFFLKFYFPWMAFTLSVFSPVFHILYFSC